MSDFIEVKNLIVKHNGLFEEFKKLNDARMDRLEERLDGFEAKDNRRGKNPAGGKEIKVPESGWRTRDGNPVLCVKANESCARTWATADADLKVSVGEAIRGLVLEDPEVVQKAAVGGTGTTGGFFIRPYLGATIIDLARDRMTAVAAGAFFVPFGEGNEMHLVRVVSDPTVGWFGEGQPVTESTPTYGRLTMRAKKMAAFVKISKELVVDAPNAASAIEIQLSAAIATELDRVIYRGSGDGEEPVGILNYTGVSEQGSVGALTYDEYLEAFQVLEEANAAPRSVILTPSQKYDLSVLKETTTDAYLAPPPAWNDVQKLVTNQLADDSQSIVGDLQEVVVGVKTQLQIEVGVTADDFQRDLISIIARWRGDVGIGRPDHLRKLTGIT